MPYLKRSSATRMTRAEKIQARSIPPCGSDIAVPTTIAKIRRRVPAAVASSLIILCSCLSRAITRVYAGIFHTQPDRNRATSAHSRRCLLSSVRTDSVNLFGTVLERSPAARYTVPWPNVTTWRIAVAAVNRHFTHNRSTSEIA